MKPEFDHPDIETLLLYGQGRLAGVWRQAIEAHIRACASCRLETRRLTRLSGSFSSVSPPSIAEVLARLSQRQNAHREGLPFVPRSGFLVPYRVHADLFLSEAIGHTPGCLRADPVPQNHHYWYAFDSKEDVESALDDAREHGYRVVGWCRCANCRQD